MIYSSFTFINGHEGIKVAKSFVPGDRSLDLVSAVGFWMLKYLLTLMYKGFGNGHGRKWPHMIGYTFLELLLHYLRHFNCLLRKWYSLISCETMRSRFYGMIVMNQHIVKKRHNGLVTILSCDYVRMTCLICWRDHFHFTFFVFFSCWSMLTCTCLPLKTHERLK